MPQVRAVMDGPYKPANGSRLETSAAVRHHHERWDGKGYPDGLTKEEIPFAARLVAIADAFDAVTANKPYPPALGQRKRGGWKPRARSSTRPVSPPSSPPWIRSDRIEATP